MTDTGPPLFIVRHDVDFPSKQAFGIQLALFVQGLLDAGAEVWLSAGRWTEPTDAGVLAAYGMPSNSRLKLLRWPKWTRGLRRWRGPLFRMLFRLRVGKHRARRPVLFILDKASNFETLLGLKPLCPSLNMRIVLEMHSDALHQLGDRIARGETNERKLARFEKAASLDPFAMAASDLVISVSEATARGLRDRCDKPVHVLRNGSATPSCEDKPLSERSGIVYPGHPLPSKGVDDLVAALARLPGEKLTIVGCRHDDDRNLVMGWAREHGVEDRVHITGYVPNTEVFRYLTSARVGAIPLKASGGSPMKAFEYMASGLPFVGSDVDANREVVTESGSGLLVPPSDPDALAAALKTLLEDNELAEKHRQAGLAWMKDNTYQRRAEKLFELLAAL